MITIALSKGRIFEETVPLLAAAGIHAAEDPESSRKLIIGTNREDVRLIIVRATDVPTYVQYGAADLGIAGKDVLAIRDYLWTQGRVVVAPSKADGKPTIRFSPHIYNSADEIALIADMLAKA